MNQTPPKHHRQTRKGRGATLNPEGRFESLTRSAFDDGWGDTGDPEPRLDTQLIEESARTIISRNSSPDLSFNRSINPYRGCEHGCIYCYARPAHSYVNLSPGLDFETRILFKPNAAELLEAELRHPGYRCEPIALGTNTDPYQPAERKLGITRGVLEVMQRFRQPFSIVSKGAAMMERDLDILADMGARGLAMVAISVTSLRDEVKRTLEPRTASPRGRLRMISRLREAGVPVMVLVAPVIPFVTDSEIEDILEQARDAGAQAADYILLRLPYEVKDLFEDWLQAHAPLRARHVMSLVRQYRGGNAEYSGPVRTPSGKGPRNPYNSSRFGERHRGTGEYARLVSQRFRLACRRLGLERRSGLTLDVTQFRVPPRAGDQMAFDL